MSTAWRAGQLAKALTSRRRPRKVWNAIFCFCIAVYLLGVSMVTYAFLEGHWFQVSTDIYVKCEDGCLITNEHKIEIPEVKHQDIPFSTLLRTVETGDRIRLKISSVSGELLEVAYQGNVIYRTIQTTLGVYVAFLCLFFSFTGLVIFLLVVINMKHPSRRLQKIQDKFIIRYYK